MLGAIARSIPAPSALVRNTLVTPSREPSNAISAPSGDHTPLVDVSAGRGRGVTRVEIPLANSTTNRPSTGVSVRNTALRSSGDRRPEYIKPGSPTEAPGLP